MPLLNATAADGLHGPPPAVAEGAPIVVMVHGYRFSPSRAAHDPFVHILSPVRRCPDWRAVPWPRHLGFRRDHPSEGLGLCFGWEARGSFWRAHAEAWRAGETLAAVIEELRAALPGRPVHAVAHSLGARVVLRALRLLRARSVERIVLMSPAEHRGAARAAMTSEAGLTAQVISVRSPENRAFDAALQLLVPWPEPAVGLGLGGLPNWLDLDPSDPGVLAVARRHGCRVAPRRLWVCHHSSYARPGLMRLYATLLRDPDRLPLPVLRAASRRRPSTPSSGSSSGPAMMKPV
jgi:pimeloyl-ACP methyl ester carboxylesterase